MQTEDHDEDPMVMSATRTRTTHTLFHRDCSLSASDDLVQQRWFSAGHHREQLLLGWIGVLLVRDWKDNDSDRTMWLANNNEIPG